MMSKIEKFQNKVDKKYGVGEYTVIDYTATRNPVTIKHKCGEIFTKSCQQFMCKNLIIQCEKCRKNQTLIDAQNKIDEKYGKGEYTLLNEEPLKAKSFLKLRHKCGYEFEKQYGWVKASITKSGLCPNCKTSQSNKTHNEIARLTYERTNGKIAYVSGYTKNTDECSFKFVKCGHEFKAKPFKVYNYYKTMYCKECNCHKELLKDKSVLDELFFHDLVDREYTANKNLYYVLKCKYCGKEHSVERRSLNTYACDCPLSIKKEIVSNANDIFLTGKTDLLCDYLKENFDKFNEFRKERTVEYTISDNVLSKLNFIEENIPTKELNVPELPFSKMLLKMNLNYELTNTKCCINEFFITKINNFGLGYIFCMSIKIGVSKEYCLEGYIFRGRIYFINDDININVRMRKGLTYCLKVINLLNKEIKRDQEIYESFRSITHSESDIIGEYDIVEFKTLTIDTSKNRMKIINKGHSKRTIKCNFVVSGHYRHYENTGKTIFIKPFEKGIEFKNIRRIEKSYIVK